MPKTKRTNCNEYRKRWRELVSNHGARCFYCRKEMATCIDHVVPYSYDHDNQIENLVPACTLCNLLASDKCFDSVEQKRQYILGQRAKRGNRQAICTDCLLPFAYRVHSPSLFLCAECYDLEYGTEYAQHPEWKLWLRQLREAGIPAEAHESLRKMVIESPDTFRAREKLDALVDEYGKVIDSDERFSKLLIYA